MAKFNTALILAGGMGTRFKEKTLEIPKGVYKVTKEQQFDPFQGITQRVID